MQRLQFIGTLATSLSCLSCPPKPPPSSQPGSFLTLHYRLAGPAGDIINTFADKPATLSLGTGELSPAVEQRLLGLEEGAHATLRAAGRRGLRRAQPRDAAVGGAHAARRGWATPTSSYAVGDVVQFPTPDGSGSYAGAVIEAKRRRRVQFDFNHPLAGQPVTFEVRLIGVL